MSAEPLGTYESLTERELEILRFIRDGLSNQQIAAQLLLMVDTVKWYNKQSYQKLGVNIRMEAIARAQVLGLFEDTTQSDRQSFSQQSITFIGRAAELTAIRTRLTDPTCRLLTCTAFIFSSK